MRLFLLFSLFTLLQCTHNIKVLSLSADMILDLPEEVTNPRIRCNDIKAYIPNPNSEYQDELRTLRINIHFINAEGRHDNYEGDEGREYAKLLVYYANNKLAGNKKMNLPEGNQTPVYDPGYRYRLTGLDKDDDGIYFHYEDSLAYFINKGKDRNNYKRDIPNKYAVGLDSILNIFYMVHPPDSVKSKTYSGSGSGIALGKTIKLGTVYNPEDKPWKYGSLFNHEVGHVLGLSHTWNLNDGCDDTPKNANCWNTTNAPPCNGVISNNMMDYNSNQHAITPCQIGKMHRNLLKQKSKQRDITIKKWCKLDPRKDVYITKDTHITRAIDLYGNLHIMDGARLTLSCRLTMPENSEIIVHPEATLVLDGTKIYNDCNKEWKGIKLLRKGKSVGKVYKDGDYEIEGVSNSSSN